MIYSIPITSSSSSTWSLAVKANPDGREKEARLEASSYQGSLSLALSLFHVWLPIKPIKSGNRLVNKSKLSIHSNALIGCRFQLSILNSQFSIPSSSSFFIVVFLLAFFSLSFWSNSQRLAGSSSRFSQLDMNVMTNRRLKQIQIKNNQPTNKQIVRPVEVTAGGGAAGQQENQAKQKMEFVSLSVPSKVSKWDEECEYKFKW